MKKKNLQCPYCHGVEMVKSGKESMSCPKCGVSISYSQEGAVSNIDVQGSDHQEVEYVARSLSEQNESNDEVKLAELESEYELATMGLKKGVFALIAAVISGLITFAGALYAFVETGTEFVTGDHLVTLFVFMIAGLVIYFSFVFGRAAKLRLEISEKKKHLEISSGENVRK